MRIFIGAMLVALAFAPVVGPAGATHAGCNGTVTNIGDALYIDDRGDANLWIYAESNGETGLQSGGAGNLNDPGGLGLVTQVDTCAHANPDTLIF